jgi:hypothetical protein
MGFCRVRGQVQSLRDGAVGPPSAIRWTTVSSESVRLSQRVRARGCVTMRQRELSGTAIAPALVAMSPLLHLATQPKTTHQVGQVNRDGLPSVGGLEGSPWRGPFPASSAMTASGSLATAMTV